MPTVRLTLFGSPRIQRDDAVLRFDTRKATALLAYLAVTGRRHRREVLSGLLWPDADPGRARATLRRTLSVAGAIGPCLRSERGEIWVDRDLVWCDVTEFAALATSDRPDDLTRAAALADGDFLAGFSTRDSPPFDEWQEGTADRLRDQHAAVLGRLVALATTDGRLADALALARERLALDPLHESAHADLIRLTAWTGDRAGALRSYRRLVRVLDAELGIPPLPATVALAEAIRADTLDPLAAGAATGRSRQQRGAAPAAPGAPRRALVGRDTERARLHLLWEKARGTPARGESGLVVGTVGPRGCGRTALLRDLSDQVAGDDHPVVRLTGRRGEQGLPFGAVTELVRALLALRPDVREHVDGDGQLLAALVPVPGRPPVRLDSPFAVRQLAEVIRAALRTIAAPPGAPLSQGGALVVVDDAHELDASSADLFVALAGDPPPGVLLVAGWPDGQGHAPLPGAVIDRVRGTGRGAVISLRPLSASASTALFLAGGGDAEVPEVVVQEAVRRSRGLPALVLELAALHREGLADAGDDAGVDSVASVCALRLDAAAPVTQQVVAAAAVLGRTADPELLRAVSGRDESETVDAIEDAAGRGLLVELDEGYAVPHDGVREAVTARTSLARRRLLHGRVADALARRHRRLPTAVPAALVARHFVEAGRGEEAAQWSFEAAEEARRLHAYPAALELLQIAQAHGHDPAVTHAAMGAALVPVGRYDEAVAALEQAAALVDDDHALLGDVEQRLASVHDRRGDWALARHHLTTARAAFAAAADARRLSLVEAELALVQHRLGDGTAWSRADAAVRQARDADPDVRARVTNVRGLIAADRGIVDTALDDLRTSVAAAREAGDPALLVAALNNLARAEATAGESTAALEHAAEALRVAVRQGDRHRVGVLHSHLADLLHDAGREEEAQEHLTASAAAFADVQGATQRPEVWTMVEW